ncbi:hypothetical protein Bpfe_016578, partial [Biomphalaria pfeifferi]
MGKITALINPMYRGKSKLNCQNDVGYSSSFVFSESNVTRSIELSLSASVFKNSIFGSCDP